VKHAAWLRSRWGSSNEHLPLLAHASVSTASKNKGIIPEIMIVEVILILEVILPERMITTINAVRTAWWAWRIRTSMQ
jgi:hypothetical protein